VEFAYRDYSTAVLKLRSVGDSNIVAVLRDALQRNSILDYKLTTQLAPSNVEFIRSFQTEDEVDDNRWIAFCKRLENAASKAGLERQFAKALTGTVEEMASNILEHSYYPSTGLVGYRWSTSEFEYVVADSGIGVLGSLRKNSHYSYLSNHLDALQTALQEGESRHGHNVGRGFGFRDLIKNIANRNSFLRFRSGDEGLMIDGTQSPPVWYTRRTQQANGLLISVVSKC
jgi:hypothetical protein